MLEKETERERTSALYKALHILAAYLSKWESNIEKIERLKRLQSICDGHGCYILPTQALNGEIRHINGKCQLKQHQRWISFTNQKAKTGKSRLQRQEHMRDVHKCISCAVASLSLLRSMHFVSLHWTMMVGSMLYDDYSVIVHYLLYSDHLRSTLCDDDSVIVNRLLYLDHLRLMLYDDYSSIVNYPLYSNHLRSMWYDD